MVSTAIILAGGFGTRLRPLTDTIPKPLLPVQGKPTLLHIIENLREHDIKNIILSVGYKAALIENYFGDGKKWGVTISYSRESEPLGTGGAVKKAAVGIKGPFVLVGGDGLMDVDFTKMKEQFKRDNADLIMALTEREDVENFGVVTLKGKVITSFINKPKREEAPTNLVDIGAYIINPACLRLLPEGKSSIEKDCFEKIVKNGNVTCFIHLGQWFPTDTPEKYKLACDTFMATK